MALSSIERVYKALVELLVTKCMAEDGVGYNVHVLESVSNCDHIPRSKLQLTLSLISFLVGPPIPSLLCPYGKACNFDWIHNDLCLRITTHLNDKDNLKASIGDLVHHINTTSDEVGTIYSVACSIFHCAIV